jgi:3-isopropylmalate/(R)-2-methylmalate dehydratase small subunit
MDDVIQGRAWVFGDSVDTDNMYPGFAMKLPLEEAARYVFYDMRPGWTDEVAAGDIVIAGRNFGIGSSRPVAQLFKQLGVVALVADEFNSLFLRNCINLGLPAVTIPGVSEVIGDGDDVRLDVRKASIESGSDGAALTGNPLPEFVLEILAGGGLLPKLVADGYIPTDPAAIQGNGQAPAA